MSARGRLPEGTAGRQPVGDGQWAQGALALRIFAIMAAGYFMSYGLRAINATIAPELVAATDLDNARLGALTSAYFVGFAAMQIPLGIWLDRYGPRRVDAVLMGVAALSCLLFGLAASFPALWFARMLLGVGMSAGLMACLASSRLWFEPRLQSRMAAWTLMVGAFGALVATVPVRAALSITDWRGVFLGCSVLLVGIALLMVFGVPRGRGEPGGARPESFLALLAGYREVGRSRFFWRMALVVALSQGSFIALQTLWIGPWFNRVLGHAPAQTAAALLAFNATLLGGYLLTGWLAPRLGDSPARIIRLVAVAVVLMALLYGFIAAAPQAAGLAAWVVAALISTVLTPLQASVAMSFPARLGGRALTAYNLMIFIAAFLIQAGLGVLVDLLIATGQAEVDGFRIGLGVVAAMQIVSLLLLRILRDPPGSGAAGRADAGRPADQALIRRWSGRTLPGIRPRRP